MLTLFEGVSYFVLSTDGCLTCVAFAKKTSASRRFYEYNTMNFQTKNSVSEQKGTCLNDKQKPLTRKETSRHFYPLSSQSVRSLEFYLLRKF